MTALSISYNVRGMSLAVALLLTLGGLAVLAGGRELLVRGAISAARQLRIPPAVVGLMLLAAACAIFFARDLFVSRWEMILFLAVLSVFLILRVKGVYDENQRPSGREEPVEPAAVLRGGVAGAMTLVFVGAGLPELATAIIAAVLTADKP
jgi:Ca2+/Na+ antiporter